MKSETRFVLCVESEDRCRIEVARLPPTFVDRILRLHFSLLRNGFGTST